MAFSVFSVASFRHDGFRMESDENIRLENNSGRIVNESADTSIQIKYLPFAVVLLDGFLMESGERVILESGFRLLKESPGQMLDENGRLLWMNDNQSISLEGDWTSQQMLAETGKLLLMNDDQSISLEGDWTPRQIFMTKQIVTFLLEDEAGDLLLETNKPYLHED